jgi:uncharacterized lipoprotein YddW (UPF0748 family)
MMKRAVTTLLGLCLAALFTSTPTATNAQPAIRIDTGDPDRPFLRGVWIATWGSGMLSPEECDLVVETARRANLNAIFPEVRKVGDAYYLNGIEPLASNIQGPEGWDPLQYLIDKCHDTSDGKQRIEVHAWLVTMRLWRQSLGDFPEGHLFDVHPETIMLNAAGENNADGTMFADPGHPMTQDWTARVFRDIAERYDIDGIHHDYVRYPEYETDWGHNPVSLARFRARTGFDGAPTATDPMWNAWRRQQVMDVVRRVTAEVMEVNPDCIVSAATLNWSLEVDPWTWQTTSPLLKAQQDWPNFMERGYLDMNVIMNYTNASEQPLRYSDWTDLALRHRSDRHAVIGPSIGRNTLAQNIAQIQEAMDKGADGVNIWSYGSLVRRGEPNDQLIGALRATVFANQVPTPPRPWKSNPTTGAVIGQVVDADGQWVDGAVVTLNGTETTLTDGTGFYAFMRAHPGKNTVEVNGARHAVEVVAGRAVRRNFGK